MQPQERRRSRYDDYCYHLALVDDIVAAVVVAAVAGGRMMLLS